MDFLNYVLENCLVMIPVLYIIGALLKQTPKVPDWTIPFVLLVLGVAGCIALSLRPDSGMTLIDAIIQGVLVTGATVLGNQMIKQATNRD